MFLGLLFLNLNVLSTILISYPIFCSTIYFFHNLLSLWAEHLCIINLWTMYLCIFPSIFKLFWLLELRLKGLFTFEFQTDYKYFLKTICCIWHLSYSFKGRHNPSLKVIYLDVFVHNVCQYYSATEYLISLLISSLVKNSCMSNRPIMDCRGLFWGLYK